MLVYVAGPYSGDTEEQITFNIGHAREVAAKLWDMGHTVICPHANTSHFERLCQKADYEAFTRGDIVLLTLCDAIVMLDGWEASKGAKGEYTYALENDIPVYWERDLPELHPTEVRSPVQAFAFRQELGCMYRTHLKKNADYSPNNILATGEIGVVTRIWDKVARLMNLSGFQFRIAQPGVIVQRLAPKSEAIEDTLLDLAVYGIIGKLLRDGKWGR